MSSVRKSRCRKLPAQVTGAENDNAQDSQCFELEKLLATVSLGSPDRSVGFAMWRLLHRYVRELDRELAPLGLTHLQYLTLIHTAWLGRSGEPVSQSELSRFGEIEPMQVSHMLKTLDAKGLIRRNRSLEDSRAKLVQLSADGLGALLKALPIAISVQRRIFGDEGRPGGPLLKALLGRIKVGK